MSTDKRLSILVIEDSAAFTRAIETVLRRKALFQFDLCKAETLAGGLKQMQGKAFDVILLDLSLPDSDSFDSLRRLRKLAPMLPVIILTGNEDEEIAIRSMQEGAQDYLLKGDLDGRMLARSILYAIERSRMLQQRDDFMAALVHDIKNPLLGSDRMFQLILEKHFGELEPELKQITGLLKQSNESVLQLLVNLLEIYRYDVTAPPFRYESLDLIELVNCSVRELTPLAKLKSLELRTSAQQGMANINADAVAMQRVFLNLIGNSIKFTPEGGSVDICVGASNGSAVVTVSDTGAGIPVADQKYLFQRFYQSSGGNKHPLGTGLGLYVCRQIIEAHMGTISCESDDKKGTTMVIELPRLAA